MKIAIMQPYFFPYIGYFQLINSVDKFVLYDDVNYIKQGWINRNSILINKTSFLFTIPLKDASSFKRINEIEINEFLFPKWKKKFLRTIDQVYKNAPYYNEISNLLIKLLNINNLKINDLIYNSLLDVCQYIGITTQIVKSSTIYDNLELQKEERIIDICKKENANVYVNPLNGMELYSKCFFDKNNISLYFIKTNNIRYKQFNANFIPSLSIIDLLMFNSIEDVHQLLNEYTLI